MMKINCDPRAVVLAISIIGRYKTKPFAVYKH